MGLIQHHIADFNPLYVPPAPKCRSRHLDISKRYILGLACPRGSATGTRFFTPRVCSTSARRCQWVPLGLSIRVMDYTHFMNIIDRDHHAMTKANIVIIHIHLLIQDVVFINGPGFPRHASCSTVYRTAAFY